MSDTASLTELIDLSGSVAVVTGAAQGFGYACADRLSEAGAKVVLDDLSPERVEAAGERLRARGRDVATVVADISTREGARSLIEHAVERYGQVDVLVNNAAAYSNYAFGAMPQAEFERVLRVNVEGVFHCSQEVVAHLDARGAAGSIVNITSIDAVHPTSPGMCHYTASKHAIWGLTKSLALELGPRGIRVNGIAPGPALTEGVVEYLKGQPEGYDVAGQWERAAQRVPLRRWTVPDEIGRVALFLASGLASYITGAQIVVDGGYLNS